MQKPFLRHQHRCPPPKLEGVAHLLTSVQSPLTKRSCILYTHFSLTQSPIGETKRLHLWEAALATRSPCTIKSLMIGRGRQLPRIKPLVHCFTAHNRWIHNHICYFWEVPPRSFKADWLPLSWGKLRREPATRWFDESFAPIPCSDKRFARQYSYQPPPQFPTASLWHGIVHTPFGSHNSMLSLKTLSKMENTGSVSAARVFHCITQKHRIAV